MATCEYRRVNQCNIEVNHQIYGPPTAIATACIRLTGNRQARATEPLMPAANTGDMACFPTREATSGGDRAVMRALLSGVVSEAEIIASEPGVRVSGR